MAEKNSLWKNIRNKAKENRRTGAKPKKPTREMIRQERKIKAKKAEGGPIGENDIPYRPLGIPMENYEPELLDNYDSTISLKRTGSNNINLRLPEYHNKKDKNLNFHPYFNASTPEPNVNVYYGGVETDLNLLNKNQNKINLKGGLGTGVVLTPGSSEYIGVQPSVGLSFTRDFAEGGYYPTQGPPKALFKGYKDGGPVKKPKPTYLTPEQLGANQKIQSDATTYNNRSLEDKVISANTDVDIKIQKQKELNALNQERINLRKQLDNNSGSWQDRRNSMERLVQIDNQLGTRSLEKEIKTLNKAGQIMLKAGKYAAPPLFKPVFNVVDNAIDAYQYVDNPNIQNAASLQMDMMQKKPFGVIGDVYDTYNIVNEKAQGGYTNPYNQYQDDPYLNYADGGYMYARGGGLGKEIAAGAYGAFEGLVDTTFGWIPGVDMATDFIYKGLQKVGKSTPDQIRKQNAAHGFAQTAGAVGSAILTGGATTAGAISEGAQGIGQGIAASNQSKDWAEGAEKIISGLGAGVGLVYGNTGSAKNATSAFKATEAGSQGLGKFAAASPIKGFSAAPKGTMQGVIDGNAVSMKPGTNPALSSVKPTASIGTFSNSNVPNINTPSNLDKTGNVINAVSDLPKSQEPPPMAPPIASTPLPELPPQTDYNQFAINTPDVNAGLPEINYNNFGGYDPSSNVFSQGGNMLNNSLNLHNTMRYKRFAQGGTLEQQGVNFITEKAGLHYQNANGGVPIGPDALAEGGEAKLQMADGGQYIVSGEVDGANTQSINGETMTQRLKKKLKPFMMGGLASNPKDKDALRRPFDSYSAESIAQVKDNAIQETEAVRMQTGGALQYAANGGRITPEIKKLVEAERKRLAQEEYTAAYGGKINPKNYPGLNYSKGGKVSNKNVQEFAKQILASKGGYVHNQMTQPMYGKGGKTGPPNKEDDFWRKSDSTHYAQRGLRDDLVDVFSKGIYENVGDVENARKFGYRPSYQEIENYSNDYGKTEKGKFEQARVEGQAGALKDYQKNKYLSLTNKDVIDLAQKVIDNNGSYNLAGPSAYGSKEANIEKNLNKLDLDRVKSMVDFKMKNKSTGGYYAQGGPIYGDPASPYTYAYGGVYGDPYAEGGLNGILPTQPITYRTDSGQPRRQMDWTGMDPGMPRPNTTKPIIVEPIEKEIAPDFKGPRNTLDFTGNYTNVKTTPTDPTMLATQREAAAKLELSRIMGAKGNTKLGITGNINYNNAAQPPVEEGSSTMLRRNPNITGNVGVTGAYNKGNTSVTGGLGYDPVTKTTTGNVGIKKSWARGGQIDYTNDMYSLYAGGGPMVSDAPQAFKGPAAQNRGGMYLYPDGGMMPPEQQMQQAPQEQMQQQGGQDQMMQMVQQIMEALMQGANPEQIMQELMQQLVQSGMPEEQAMQQAQQIIQVAMQEVQGQQQPQGQPMQEGQQMPPQQGMARGGRMRYDGGGTKPPYTMAPISETTPIGRQTGFWVQTADGYKFVNQEHANQMDFNNQLEFRNQRNQPSIVDQIRQGTMSSMANPYKNMQTANVNTQPETWTSGQPTKSTLTPYTDQNELRDSSDYLKQLTANPAGPTAGPVNMYNQYTNPYPLVGEKEERLAQIESNMNRSLNTNANKSKQFNQPEEPNPNGILRIDEEGNPVYKYEPPKVPAKSVLTPYTDAYTPAGDPNDNSFLYKQDGIPMEGYTPQNAAKVNNQRITTPLSGFKPGINFTQPELDLTQPVEQPLAAQPAQTFGPVNQEQPTANAKVNYGATGPITEAEAIAQGYKPQITTTTTSGVTPLIVTDKELAGINNRPSWVDIGIGASQLAGAAHQFFQAKPEPFKYDKMQATTLNPTPAIVAANQAAREAQALTDYNIKQNAPTSGSYLANIRANALQSAKQRGAAASGIQQQYDIQNAGILNQMEQQNTEIENRNIDAIQEDLANFQEQRTNALYNAGANIAGMRRDYKANEINQTIANNIGTSNYKLISDDKGKYAVVYRDANGAVKAVPYEQIVAGNTQTPAANTTANTPATQPNAPAKTAASKVNLTGWGNPFKPAAPTPGPVKPPTPYTGPMSNYLNNNQTPNFSELPTAKLVENSYPLNSTYNYSDVSDYVPLPDKTDKETIKAFQDYLDLYQPNWTNSGNPLKKGKGYGNLGNQTKKAWEQYGKSFLGRVPNSYRENEDPGVVGFPYNYGSNQNILNLLSDNI